MKKINYFFAAAMICMSVAACVKEAGNDNPGVNSGNTTEETIPDNYIELSFQTPGMNVKTSVDGNTVSWTQGDKIRICWEGGSSVSNAVVFEDGNASFTAMVAPEATDFYAVYPSTIEATVAEDNFNVTIPSSQSGRFADADIIVAKTSKEHLAFAFHHAVSLVKFVISEENQKGISRAQFVDLANNSQLTGALSIAFDESNAIASSTVTEDTTLDVIDVTAVQPGDNYMAVLPSKELAGFGLRLGSESKWYSGLVSETPVVAERLPLGTVDTRIHEGDFYIKPEASGKGNATSWENAGGPEMLQSLMGNITDYKSKNLARAWRVNGKTICVANGEYKAIYKQGFTAGYTTDGISFTIEGGFSTNGTKDENAITLFGSESENTNDRAFFFAGKNVDITIKDLTVKNHHYSTSMGSGVYVALESSLTAENCKFENNIAQNNKRGGAVGVGTDAHFNASGCQFIDNGTENNGGAISTTTSLILNDCYFEGNNAASGGAIYISGENATLMAENCTFSDNHSDGTSHEGGAISMTNGHLLLNSCSFESNSSANGGAIYISGENATLKANKCKFIGNTSDGTFQRKNGSADGRESSSAIAPNGATCFFNACEFRENRSGGKNAYVGTIYSTGHDTNCLGFNNCLFTDNQRDPYVKTFFNIYTGAEMIVSNSTAIETMGGDATPAVIRSGGSGSTFVNNIIINTDNTARGLQGSKTSLSTYNIISNINTISAGEGSLTGIYSLDGTLKTHTNSMLYYSWSGSVGGFTYTSKTNVANTIKSNAKFGQDFYNWLTSLDYGNGLNALDVDIRGVERTSTVWPGSYQN